MIQQPGSNALAASEQVLNEMEDASQDFPAGIKYSIPYNPTESVQASVEAVQETLLEAIVLVMLVVLVFLQTWRASIIPNIAIPVALVRKFAVPLALGLYLQSLALDALVMAFGKVH